ncbi:hypothetical protein GCM10018785_11880 [Streptomyces longispororuber]|uniref:Uncharacterized protein n=1 Tax=Streptomyces longispororuber TaxID=68230 RepID=A0A919DFT2_9ACTN|nr:hypothetical protein [Streptomyces longispororuber]GHE43928.1 hypothetical protein GCM10018785_11880 [Streptomyces longispororuber]
MGRYIMPVRTEHARRPAGLTAALTAALTGAALMAGSGVAAADTNTATEKSTMLCNVVLLSPGADVGDCSNVQVTGQNMVKNGTVNTALVDYAKVETVTGLLP